MIYSGKIIYGQVSCTGYFLTGPKLANDGQDMRAIQHYLGHRNIQHTTRYTELASDRFKNFWHD